MAVIFGTRKEDSHYEIFRSTGTRRLLNEIASQLGS